ncbi:Glutathione-dependent formaldehyde-activating enzyme/centromere protein V [Penicillium fimorum]|uniref:Glutathione-dependent formaldehyde-activating enzyme/centromere protein V n=1 Tax=Penicillium fimorum TaxID=1882269 RepID=A0A9W9Y3G1_9EURO|nr:Glutathione-dependent formaldehyde-activating enzyme/centromere protein V [Penicillium fimorum]
MPFPPTPTGESSSHSGKCHCGAVRFNFTLSPPLYEYPTNSCNCSICTKNGYLLVYPFNKDLTVEQGDTLKDYLFAGHKAKHQFCGRCGSSCFIRPLEEGAPSISAVNVRLLHDIDIEKLDLNKVDGKSVGPAYKV